MQKVWARYSDIIFFFNFSLKMFNISYRNERTWVHIGFYIPRPCPANHVCTQGPTEWKLPTIVISLQEYHTWNQMEKELAFIYWLHFFCFWVHTCTEIRLLDQTQGNNKAKSRGFGCWGTVFSHFPPSIFLFLNFFFNNSCSDFL